MPQHNNPHPLCYPDEVVMPARVHEQPRKAGTAQWSERRQLWKQTQLLVKQKQT